MFRWVPSLVIAAALLAFPGGAAASSNPVSTGDAKPVDIAYSKLITLSANGHVKAAMIDDVTGTATVTLDDGTKGTVNLPSDGTGDLATSLAQHGAAVTIGSSSGSPGGSGLIPLLIFGILVATVAGLFLAGHLRARRTTRRAETVQEAEPTQRVCFDDVAGCDEAVTELRDVLDFLRKPERFEKLGATLPSGVILHGPPGTGKTLLAKALAGEAGVPFFAASGSDFVEMFVGVGPRRVRELFSKARRSERGAVVFIDEIDAIGRKRSPSPHQTNQEGENTLNALLVELDGFHGREHVIVVAATNRVDILDDALLRPGRFGLQIEVGLPDEAGRREILDLYAKDKPLADDVDLDALAAYTAGSSGAQLADMMNQGAIVAARRDADEIADADLREGHLRVLAGPERVANPARQDERRVVAWHEAGHVLAAELLETQDKAQRVTIRPRGRAAGLAVYGQTDRALHSRRYLHERMICILAGRAAEQLLMGEISSGAANDLQQVNHLARHAVLELGFSERVGQLISHGGTHHLADDTRRVVDEEVERMVADAYQDALRLLEDERSLLDALAEALLEHGQLERVDILVALGGTPPVRETAPRRAPMLVRPRRLHVVPEVIAPFQKREGRLVALARWIEQRPSAKRRREAA